MAEAKVSPRPEKGIIAHNYQRLINKIKGSATEHYNPEEYRRAFHNPMFSHIVNKTIVKHPSDWYYKKNDSVWQNFLNMLSEEAPLWRSYSEEFLDSMVWMQDVTKEKLGPEVWHMHPLVFLDSFHSKKYDFSTKEGTIHAIISECKNQGISLNTQIAYILATVKRETGDAFQPVREGNYGGRTVSDEYRKKKFRYYPYYGRGYVQITWKYNYEKYSQKLNVDMVNEPDLALNPEYSLFILIDGFKYGEFTGKKITDYINESKTDFYNARKCINGLDQADQIKGFAEDYLEKLNNGLLAWKKIILYVSFYLYNFLYMGKKFVVAG
ncbi:glycoside hydrolase family 19 protein [Providencia stuartii]|nr:glycoside hydrolase family 19 protein [Providencia stuartii]